MISPGLAASIAALLLLLVPSSARALESEMIGTWQRVGVVTDGRLSTTSARSVFLIDPNGGYESATLLPDRIIRLKGTLLVEDGGRATLRQADGQRQDLGILRVEQGYLLHRPPGSRSEYLYQRAGNTKPDAPKKP